MTFCPDWSASALLLLLLLLLQAAMCCTRTAAAYAANSLQQLKQKCVNSRFDVTAASANLQCFF
jgi:hypothetical protein